MQLIIETSFIINFLMAQLIRGELKSNMGTNAPFNLVFFIDTFWTRTQMYKFQMIIYLSFKFF